MNLTITPSPNSTASHKRFFSGRGNACPRPTGAALASQGTPELCPSTSVAETPSPLLSRPTTVPTGEGAAAAPRPPGCWPSCFRLMTCANEAWGALRQRGSADASALPCCYALCSSAGFAVKVSGERGLPDTYRLHLPPSAAMRGPPREGLRPRPRGAAGPQRQGPHCRPTRAPGIADTASRAREAEPWGAPPWTSWAPCCGCFTMPAPAAASPATRRSPRRAAAPAPPSPRPST